MDHLLTMSGSLTGFQWHQLRFTMPKIILTGVAGVGKTTLARCLAQALSAKEVIEEEYGSLLRFKKGTEESQKIAILRKKATQWLQSRINLCISPESDFVMDRGPMDILHFSLVRGFYLEHEWKRLFQVAHQALTHVDLVVIPLLESMEQNSIDNRNEDGIERAPMKMINLRNQALIIGLCFQLLPASKVLLLPRQPCSTEERVSLIQRKLDKLRN